jgi:hypothetical protein
MATQHYRVMLAFVAKLDVARLLANDRLIKAALAKLGWKTAVNTADWLAEHSRDTQVNRFWTNTEMHCLAEQIAAQQVASAA